MYLLEKKIGESKFPTKIAYEPVYEVRETSANDDASNRRANRLIYVFKLVCWCVH